MSQTTHTISLPAVAFGAHGILNCVSAAPLYDRAKRFRKLGRKTVEVNNTFNAIVDKLGLATKAFAAATPDTAQANELRKVLDAVQVELDQADEATYEALFDQLKGSYIPHTFSPDDKSTHFDTLPTMDSVQWEEVNVIEVKEAVNFFGSLTSG